MLYYHDHFMTTVLKNRLLAEPGIRGILRLWCRVCVSAECPITGVVFLTVVPVVTEHVHLVSFSQLTADLDDVGASQQCLRAFQ